MRFMSVKEKMPLDFRLCLVKTTFNDEVCLAKFRCINNSWEVQPFLGKWYETTSGVKEWAYVNQYDVRQDKCNNGVHLNKLGILLRSYYNTLKKDELLPDDLINVLMIDAQKMIINETLHKNE